MGACPAIPLAAFGIWLDVVIAVVRPCSIWMYDVYQQTIGVGVRHWKGREGKRPRYWNSGTGLLVRGGKLDRAAPSKINNQAFKDDVMVMGRHPGDVCTESAKMLRVYIAQLGRVHTLMSS
jgi:hypothetical protein